ncbi:hypothetical protein LPJ71_003822, partial [Coemansia sp. S17]
MRTFSPLQLLPPHVVEPVVNHVVGSSRLLANGIDCYSLEYKMLLLPLLSVCHNIRAIAHAILPRLQTMP